MAGRLAQVLPRLLHPDQAGFVRGRSAPDIALTVKSVLAHAAEYEVEGALVFLDQEKAYDRVSHDYLRAVLLKFGFPPSLAHIFANTSGPSHSFILDDGQPLPAIPISCGVRQGDPLAPLLYNLAIEPLLATLRARLRGVPLPWGAFKTGAYADDLTVGLAPSDLPVLLEVLAAFGRASNSRINLDKSHILDLSDAVTTPPWIQSSGFFVHPSANPVQVLGFDLSLSPSGVAEDWSALYQDMSTTATRLSSRSCALQGRTLLANSMVLSKLWYKGQLSSPSLTVLRHMKALAWDLVWAGSTALKPGFPTGRRSRLQGGVGILDPQTQLRALQARWITRFLDFTSPRPPWWSALNYALSTCNGGSSALATRRSLANFRPSACWTPFVQAWRALHPHWSLDMSLWTASEALCFPVPATKTSLFRSGLRLIRFVKWARSTSEVRLATTAELRARNLGAPGRTSKALAALHARHSPVPPPVLSLALSSSSSRPERSPLEQLHAHILVADVPVFSLTTALARRFLNQRAGLCSPFDWGSRAITALGPPPPDIWRRLHHPALSPRLKETFYKFLFNALPLGRRIHHFAADQLSCHFCPGIPQTLRHFVFQCPLAQAVWQEFRSLFSLPSTVSLFHAAFSWSPGAVVRGCHLGYQLQAGHALALHVLWQLHCAAVYQDRPAAIAGARALFRADLLRYIETHLGSSSPTRRRVPLEAWCPPLSFSSSFSSLALQV